MTRLNRTGAVLRMTALTAALMGVYGPGAAVATPVSNQLICDPTCVPVVSPGADYHFTGSTQNWVVNANTGADVTLEGGSVKGHGTNVRGVIAQTGSKVTAKGVTISTDGIGAHGVQAFVAANELTSAPQVTLEGGSVTVTNDGAWGLYATRGGQIKTTGTDILTNGLGGFGAFVESNSSNERSGGLLELNGGSITTTGAKNLAGHGSHGVIAKHAGNTAKITNTAITTNGDYANALLAEEGGSITAKNATIVTKGEWAFGANATGGGTIALDGGTVTTTNPKGKGVQDGNGSRAYALQATGTGSKVTTKNGTAILTEGQRAYGAYAVSGGEVDLKDSSIETHGFMAYGAYASGAGSKLTTNNVNITTTGDVGDAVWAYNGGEATINGGRLSVAGGMGRDGETGNGLTAVGGTNGSANGVINANGVTVITTGADSAGVLAGSDIGSDRTSGTVNLNNTSVTATGARATAAHVLYGSTFNATNASKLVSVLGDGVTMKDNATVNLNNTTVEAKGASLVSNLTVAGQSQNITVGNGSTLLKNNGTLLQVNRTGAGVDGNVNLTLKSGSFSVGNVVDKDINGKTTTPTVEAGAQWAGIVIDKNTVVVPQGQSSTFDSTPIAGSVATSGNSLIVFSNGAQIGGSISSGAGSTAQFNGTAQIAGHTVAQGGAVNFGGATTIGQSVTGSQGSSFTFAGATSIGQNLAGQGTSFVFSQTAPTTIGGSIQLDQGSTLRGGTTSAPITIAGGTSVSTGATLGGNLFVSGALSGAGGSLSPGNSVGTQSYDTSAGFTGAYVAEVNGAGQSDLIIIRNGNFNLAGVNLTVAEENGNGGYLLNHDYTIVQTVAGDVQNTFAQTNLDTALQNKLVKLDPVKYGQKDVKVSLSADLDKIAGERGNLTANQNATLDGLLSVSSANTLTYAALTSADRQSALNQLSGEAHASTQSALLNSGNLLVRTLSSRMRGNAGAGLLAGAPTAQASGSLPASAMPSSAAYPLWAQVVGSWQEQKGDSNTANTKTDTAGLFIGGDTQVGAGWRVGGALGFTDGKVKVSDRSSTSDVTSYTAALYGANSWATAKGKVNFLAGAGYTRHNIDSRRTVNVGGNQTLKADYDANTMQLFTELGYALPVGQASEVEPYVGLGWINQRAKGFSESGGSAALAGQSQTDSLTTFTLGVRGNTAFSAGKRDGKLFAGLGWRNASGDVNASRKLSFIQGNGAQFQVSGAPIAKNAAVLDLGGEMSVGKNTAMGVSYNGQFGNGSTDNAGSLYLKMRF